MTVTISVHPMELVSEVMKYVMVNARVGTVLMRITAVSVISEMHMDNCFIIIHLFLMYRYVQTSKMSIDVRILQIKMITYLSQNEYRCAYGSCLNSSYSTAQVQISIHVCLSQILCKCT